jgi:hypothetical protein
MIRYHHSDVLVILAAPAAIIGHRKSTFSSSPVKNRSRFGRGDGFTRAAGGVLASPLPRDDIRRVQARNRLRLCSWGDRVGPDP